MCPESGKEPNEENGSSSLLNFEVSSGLKSVLGSELITNDEVAIFELVKNSFDANATRVDIHFTDDVIVIADNGTGMSLDDINNKWLVVAYSAKRNSSDYRETVSDRRHYAGSKGIGRFSSDRLGGKLILQTRHEMQLSGPVHRVEIKWKDFDKNARERFEVIPVVYGTTADFDIPKEIPPLKSGTVIEVRDINVSWSRDTILKLKSSLAKLINPFGADVDGFRIHISAPSELSHDNADKLILETLGMVSPNRLVNGYVGNFIFSELRNKTTFIEVALCEAENVIETKLIDRGELIYRIREKNPYTALASSGFRCELYYLNRSAKVTFTNRVGLPSIQFGSVFLFRNGFRVYPIGEGGDDWFGIDRRKQQGYARFLGTRDIIGRIDVAGSEEHFKESSSRNQGLIETSAAKEIRTCFREYCLKRLEKYVVPVSWVDQGEADASDLSRLLTEPGRARVSAAVAALVDNAEVELVEYSHKLVGLLNERSEKFESSLTSLKLIAEKTNDENLKKNIEAAEGRFEELKIAEAEARKTAELERQAKQAALERARVAEQAAKEAQESLIEEKKTTLFLQSVSALDSDTILNLHHQITIYSVDIDLKLRNFIAKSSGKETIPVGEVVTELEKVLLLNKRISAVSKFATKANFRLDSEAIERDLAQYVYEYVDEIAKSFKPSGLQIYVENTHPGFVRVFKPIDISVVVDNFISNSNKARATKVSFIVSQPKNRKNTLQIEISDNGNGLSAAIEPERLFEKGYSRTNGAGLGLYHVRQVLGEMNGSVKLGESSSKGATFIVEVTKS